MADDKIKKCNLGPSAPFTGVNHNLSAELTQKSARGLLQTKWSAFIAVISH